MSKRFCHKCSRILKGRGNNICDKCKLKKMEELKNEPTEKELEEMEDEDADEATETLDPEEEKE